MDDHVQDSQSSGFAQEDSSALTVADGLSSIQEEGSQEIGKDSLIAFGLNTFGNCLEHAELFLQLSVHFHYCPHVVTSIAVVRGRPNCHEVLRLEPKLEPVLDQLMGSGYKLHSIYEVEVADYLRSEYPSSSTTVACPALYIFWIGPHQITERALMRNFHFAIDGAHLIDSFCLWRESSVDAQDFVLDDCTEGKIVKGLIEVLPRGGASILLGDLVVEAICCCDLARFVIPSQQNDVFGVLQFVAKQQLDCLNRVVTPIHKVSDENVPRLRQFTSHFEQLEHVIELSMNVPTNYDRRICFMNI